MASTEMTLRQEAEAGRRLISGIADLVGDNDIEARHDMIEGETNLFEALSRGLDELNDCQIMITGIREQEALLSERRERITRRKEMLCALIEQSMLSIEVFSVRLPTATLSVAKRPQALEIVSEADIPSKFWVLPEPPAPRLDRRALLTALQQSQLVPGATLGEVSYSLTVRRK